jgi:hypothetical protein
MAKRPRDEADDVTSLLYDDIDTTASSSSSSSSSSMDMDESAELSAQLPGPEPQPQPPLQLQLKTETETEPDSVSEPKAKRVKTIHRVLSELDDPEDSDEDEEEEVVVIAVVENIGVVNNDAAMHDVEQHDKVDDGIAAAVVITDDDLFELDLLEAKAASLLAISNSAVAVDIVIDDDGDNGGKEEAKDADVEEIIEAAASIDINAAEVPVVGIPACVWFSDVKCVKCQEEMEWSHTTVISSENTIAGATVVYGEAVLCCVLLGVL